MVQNTKMASECVSISNENSMLVRAERIYSKQRQLQTNLLEINNALLGSDVLNNPEINADCIMGYLDETESILNCSLDVVHNILDTLR